MSPTSAFRMQHSFLSWATTTFLKILVEVVTSGLPQVCKPWIEVRKGMLLVKHLAPKIIVCQLARRLGWAAPAYQKKEGATPHPGMCKLSLQHDRWSDERLWVRVRMWKLGSLRGKREKFVKN